MAEILEPAPYRVQVIDRNGLVSPEWLKWLDRWRTLLAGTSTANDTLALAAQLASLQATLASVKAQLAVAGPLRLETNSALNGSQTLLSLLAGPNITLSENGAGEVTISATAGTSDSAAGATADASPPGIEFNLYSVKTGSAIVVSSPSRRASTLTAAVCEVYVIASDPSVGLAFDIQQAGVSIFSSAPTLAAGTVRGLYAVGTLLSPIAIAQNDVFSLDVGTGNKNWKFTLTIR